MDHGRAGQTLRCCALVRSHWLFTASVLSHWLVRFWKISSCAVMVILYLSLGMGSFNALYVRAMGGRSSEEQTKGKEKGTSQKEFRQGRQDN